MLFNTLCYVWPHVCTWRNTPVHKQTTTISFFFFDNRGTFHGKALRTLHGDPNLGVLTTLEQPTSGRFMVLSMAGVELRTMCHLLGPYFLVFAFTNWTTLTGNRNQLFLGIHVGLIHRGNKYYLVRLNTWPLVQ